MKTEKELADKAIELNKQIFNLSSKLQLSKKDEFHLEQLKSAYTTLMYVLGYKQESIYFDCRKYKLADKGGF